MTCVVAVIEGGKAYIGSDCAGVSGFDVTERKDPKVFVNDGFLIGYTSSFRMGQLLRFKFKPPEYREEKKCLYEYMCTDFIDSVRNCFKDGGYARKTNEEEAAGVFIVCHSGRIFKIEADYQVGEALEPYQAVGCGEDYAKGALFAINDSIMQPFERIEIALKCAEKYSAGVRSPFKILKESA